MFYTDVGGSGMKINNQHLKRYTQHLKRYCFKNSFIRQNKKIGMFTVTGLEKSGLVGQDFVVVFFFNPNN